MPVFLVILLLPFAIMMWIIRYCLRARAEETEIQFLQEIARAKREAQIARPLKDYVAGLQPKQAVKVPPPLPFMKSSPPTLENIGRFAALSIQSHGEEYFVKDGQGQVYGPAEEDVIRRWIREERMGADTLISNDAKGPWLPARQIRAFQDVFQEMVRSAVAPSRFDNIKLR